MGTEICATCGEILQWIYYEERLRHQRLWLSGKDAEPHEAVQTRQPVAERATSREGAAA